MENVLVITGGAGFIGSEVARQALSSGHFSEVHVADKLHPDSARSANIPTGAKLHVMDICVPGLFKDLLKSVNATHVAHLAAESHVDRSFQNPVSTIRNNIESTVQVLEACKDHLGIKRLLHMSTDEVYGDSHFTGERGAIETDEMRPTNPYAASKGACELLALSYFRSYRLPVVIARGNNVYGPYQAVDKVVPKFILHTLRGEDCPIHGDGSQLRSFIYVSDMASVLIKMVTDSKIEVGTILNVEGERELSIRQLAEQIRSNCSITTGSSTGVVSVADRPYNDKRYWVDGSKSKEILGPYATTPFSDGLRRTIAWYASSNIATSKEPLRVLVVGGKGMIGQAVIEEMTKQGYLVDLFHGSRIGENQSRFEKELHDAIVEGGYTHILCTLGRTHRWKSMTIDDLEPATPEDGPDCTLSNVRDNVYAPLAVAAMAKQHNLHCTYIGTGCIYTFPFQDGSLNTTVVQNEDDAPTFFGSSYSVAKGFTDRLMGQMNRYGSNILNVRIRLPLDVNAGSRNLLTKLSRYDAVPDLPNSLTYLPECIPLLVAAMHARYTGTLHLVNPEPVSTAWIKTQLKESNLCGDFKTLDTDDGICAVVKRSQCLLDTTATVHLAKKLNVTLSSSADAVKKAIDVFKTVYKPET